MNMNDLTFGVEIETRVPTGSVSEWDIAIGNYHNGITVKHFPSWSAERDPSIGWLSGYTPAEFVSRVLSGEDGLMQVAEFVEWLQEIGADSDRSCGIHVHVGSFGNVSRPYLIEEFKRVEGFLFSVCGDQAANRRGNNYCKPSKHWDRHYPDRYQSLNWEDWSDGVIEFRLFAARVDVEYVLSCVYVCLAFVANVCDRFQGLGGAERSDIIQRLESDSVPLPVLNKIKGEIVKAAGGDDSYDDDGYDDDGYDDDGYDDDGYDRDGYDRRGYDRRGYDADGYDRHGYDWDGFDRDGYNADGYDDDGYDRDGYDYDGYDRDGYDYDGYDYDGYDRDGYDYDGYDRDGYNADGYDRDGFDRDGYDADGYDRDGFDRDGYDRDGFDRDGYTKSGYRQLVFQFVIKVAYNGS